MRESKKNYLNQINFHKLEAKKQAQTVLKLIENQKKLTDWSQCSHKKLTGFKDSMFVSGLCKLYYGDNGLPRCIQQRYFCRMCCKFHIGLNHLDIRKKCIKKCDKLINEKFIEILEKSKNVDKKKNSSKINKKNKKKVKGKFDGKKKNSSKNNRKNRKEIKGKIAAKKKNSFKNNRKNSRVNQFRINSRVNSISRPNFSTKGLN